MAQYQEVDDGVNPVRSPGLARISSFFATISVACVLLLMTIMIADILTRTITGGALAGGIEIAQTLLVAIVFFGIAYAERHGDNVRVQLLGSRLSPRSHALMAAVGTFVAFGMAAWFSYATYLEARHSLAINEYQIGLVQYPLWPARLVIFVGFLVLTLEFLASFIRRVQEAVHSEVVPINHTRDGE